MYTFSNLLCETERAVTCYRVQLVGYLLWLMICAGGGGTPLLYKAEATICVGEIRYAGNVWQLPFESVHSTRSKKI